MRRAKLIALDLLLVIVATMISFILRANFDTPLPSVLRFLPYVFFTGCAAVAILVAGGLDRRIWRYAQLQDHMRLLSASVAIVACALISGFAYDRLAEVPRALPLIQVVFIATALIGARVAYRGFRSYRRRHTVPAPTALIPRTASDLVVGINPLAELFAKCAQSYASQRVAICGLVSEGNGSVVGRFAYGLPVLGSIADLPALIGKLELQGVSIRRIMVTIDREGLHPSDLSVLKSLETQATYRIEYLTDAIGFAAESEVGGRSTAHGEALSQGASDETHEAVRALVVASRRSYWIAKRAFDIAVASVLIVTLALPIVVLAGVTAVTMGMPIIFWQFRPGRYAKPIKIYKFRTMHDAFTPQGRRVPDSLRHSTVGSLMRRFRLDELPQLFSILKGDMSFVGPRPLLAHEQAACPSARLLVRPGLTGWAQVNGGRNISIEDKLALDLWYIKNASFALDVEIALATILMLGREDARQDRKIQDARTEFSSVIGVAR